jgi:hypothetical protein
MMHHGDAFHHTNPVFPFHNDLLLYTTFIHMSISQCLKFFILITHCLFKTWQEGAALQLHFLFFAAPGEADNLLTMGISMMISHDNTQLQ